MDLHQNDAQWPVCHFELDPNRETAPVLCVPFRPLCIVVVVEWVGSGCRCPRFVARFKKYDILDLFAP